MDELRARAAEIEDLGRIASLLSWDQQVMMPRSGAGARAEQHATVQRLIGERLSDPELGRLIDAASAGVESEDPLDDDAALLRLARREHRKAVRVPATLRAERARAAAVGHQAWEGARAADDFAAFLPFLERNVELARHYADCFPEAADPYDALLDDYEPGATAAEVEARFAEIRAGLVPLIARITAVAEPPGEDPLRGSFPPARQRELAHEVISALGASDDAWRLDDAVHPFSTALAIDDIRITSRYDPERLGFAIFCSIHEFGHGLYEHGVAPELARTPLAAGTSLGIHESQSRLWENVVARSRPFCRWLAPRIERAFPEGGAIDPAALHRAVNRVAPSLIRVEADEATYPLHIVLRFELERELVAGRLEPAALPEAWNAGMAELLGVEVPSDRLGVLQDVHWAQGAIGYFPTYLLGSAIAAQLWESLLAATGDLESAIAAGDFAPIRDWLREHVHRHGRKLLPAELLERATGRGFDSAPYLRYLRAKYSDPYGLEAGPDS